MVTSTISGNTGESLEVFLYDITAREMVHQWFNSTVTLNTDQLPTGIYLYILKIKAGKEITGKLIIE